MSEEGRMPDGHDTGDREQIVRLTVAIEHLAKEFHGLNERIGRIEERVTDASIPKTVAVLEDRVKRLQTIVYTCLATLGIETLGIVSAVIIWAITKK